MKLNQLLDLLRAEVGDKDEGLGNNGEAVPCDAVFSAAIRIATEAQKLADRILAEAREQAKHEAEQILDEARAQARIERDQAKAEAKRIVAEAHRLEAEAAQDRERARCEREQATVHHQVKGGVEDKAEYTGNSSDAWHFKFDPKKVSPLEGGGGKQAESFKPSSCTAKSNIWPKFTFVSPSVFQFTEADTKVNEDGTAATCSEASSSAATAPMAGGAVPNELFGAANKVPAPTADVHASPTAEADATSTASTGRASKASRAAHSIPPECAGGTSSHTSNEQSPSSAHNSGSRSTSASPMDVDASGSKVEAARRSKGVFVGERTKVRDKTKLRSKKESKDSDERSDGFVFEVSEMLKRTVLQPTGPAQHAGHAEGAQRTEAWGAEGMGADATDQPQGPSNHACATGPELNSATNLAFAFEKAQQSHTPATPTPKTAGGKDRRGDRKNEKKSEKKERAAAKSTEARAAFAFTASATVSQNLPAQFDLPKSFSFMPKHHAAPPYEPAHFTFSIPPSCAHGGAESNCSSSSHSQNQSSANPPGFGGFAFHAPKESEQLAGRHDTMAGSASSAQPFEQFPSAASPSREASSSAARAMRDNCRVMRSSRASRNTLAKKSPPKPAACQGSGKGEGENASPTTRPEQEQEAEEGACFKSGGGFNFSTPFKSQLPADFKWQEQKKVVCACTKGMCLRNCLGALTLQKLSAGRKKRRKTPSRNSRAWRGFQLPRACSRRTRTRLPRSSSRASRWLSRMPGSSRMRRIFSASTHQMMAARVQRQARSS
jgi:hypothetical protein